MRRSKRLQEKAQKAPVNVPTNANARKLAKNASNRKGTIQLLDGNTNKIAFHILPEEVWIIIFHLLDSMDCYHAMHACPEFLEILRPKMTTWLFTAILPNIYCYVSKRYALKCRQVCKTWRNGFDKMVELTLCPKAVLEQSTNLEDVIRRQCRMHFPVRISMRPSTHLVQNSWMQRLPMLKEHPSNPIIGRYVVFWEEYNSATFFQNALRVVNQVGSHLSHIGFVDEDSFRGGTTEDQYYLILQQCLTFVPNLKSLVITKASGLRSFRNESQLLTQNPLPNMEHLNTLILLSAKIPRFIHNQLIIKYASQLQHLKCKWNFYFDDVAKSTKALKLEEFSIFQVSHSNKSRWELANFLRSPYLKKLQIWFDEGNDGYGLYGSSDENRGWEMDGFLRLLAKFPKLVYVDIYYRNDFTWKNCFSNCLAAGSFTAHVVPSLKVLKLIESPCGIVYDFLEYLPNLQQLYVKNVLINGYGYRVDDPKAKIRLTEHLYLNTIQESNVWTILKKLELVQFEKVKLTNRNDYYARQEQVISQNKCTRREYEAFLQLHKRQEII